MKNKFSILDLPSPIGSENAPPHFLQIKNRKSEIENAFTLVEVMVVVALLSLIVIALMSVFNSTQSAFRASVTQSDVLEGGRAAMDLMAQDLKAMAPSLGQSNAVINGLASGGAPVNFFVVVEGPTNTPLVQPLVGSSIQRTNVLEGFFILSRQNRTWTGTAYWVDAASTAFINPLYRFSTNMNVMSGDSVNLYNAFSILINNRNFTTASHLTDGVVGLRVRAFDPNGAWMTGNTNVTRVKNVFFLPPGYGTAYGETAFYMFSNALPASVEVEMATLEDRTLQRAETWPDGSIGQSNYLAQQSGKVHIFRQRVSIPNVDPSAYQ